MLFSSTSPSPSWIPHTAYCILRTSYSAMPARHLLITGLVQGVFFRAEAKKKADALKLTGWVRNNDADGSLEMHIEGQPAALQQFEQWCARGPDAARVEECEARDAPEDYGKSFVVQMSS